jgi:hypothetical protein
MVWSPRSEVSFLLPVVANSNVERTKLIHTWVLECANVLVNIQYYAYKFPKNSENMKKLRLSVRAPTV